MGGQFEQWFERPYAIINLGFYTALITQVFNVHRLTCKKQLATD